MRSQQAASRYARALFDLASERSQIDLIAQDLGLLQGLLEADGLFRAVMADTLISQSIKRDLVEKLFSGHVSPLTLDFLRLTIQKRREGLLALIIRTFSDLADEASGLVRVEVRSAVELPPDIIAALEKRLISLLGKRVAFNTRVDPALIGGVAVRYGDQLIDGSIRTRLRRMRDRLTQPRTE